MKVRDLIEALSGLDADTEVFMFSNLERLLSSEAPQGPDIRVMRDKMSGAVWIGFNIASTQEFEPTAWDVLLRG